MARLDLLKKFFLKILFYSILFTMFVQGHTHTDPSDANPEFLQPLSNLSVTQGRDVSFTCVVNDLGPYKVAWIKSDSKAILAIHTHMVALNQRLSVTHNGHNTWKLHIAHVQLNDSGSYMCQVNTDPMRSQSGYLDVVVSPDILNVPESNSATLEEGITNEGGQIQLICTATGVPEPTVQWRREDGKDIVLRTDGREKQLVKFIEGERLLLQQVQRTDMGGYLCIASNGVPPSVSKRFDVQVNFPPIIRAVSQILGAPVESRVSLLCEVEVFPKALNSWVKNGVKLHNDGQRYTITETTRNSYTWIMNLTILNMQKTDVGEYECSSQSGLGKQDARVRLQEMHLEKPPTTTPVPYLFTTVKPPRRKHHQSHNNKAGHELSRVKETLTPNQIQENEIIGGVGIGGNGGSLDGVLIKVSAAASGRPGSNNGLASGGNGGVGSGSGGGTGNGNGGNGNIFGTGGMSNMSGMSGSSSSSGNSINSNGIEKTRNSQTLAAVPSQRPPWIYNSSIKQTAKENLIIWIFCCLLLMFMPTTL